MEDCFTTIWYVNCTACESGPMTSSQHDPTLKILCIVVSTLLLILLIVVWALVTFKKSAEFVFPVNDAIDRSV